MTTKLERVRDYLARRNTRRFSIEHPIDAEQNRQAIRDINAHLKAVREVIESHINEAKNLRHDPESQDYLYAQAGKLEAAIRGEPS